MKRLLRNMFLATLVAAFGYLQAQPCDLTAAIKASDVTAVQACLGTKSDLDLRDAKGRTPLLQAVVGEGGTIVPERQKKIVTALLAAGADVNAADEKGYTALHYAAYQGTFDLVELLLAQGADLGLKTIAEETPLHLAARGPLLDDGRYKTFEVLLAARPALGHADTAGRTVVHLLCAHKARLESPEVVDETLLKLLTQLRDLGASLQPEDNRGYTAFANAMREGHVQTALWLLQQGARPQQAVLAPYSALHMAVERHQLPLADALLQAGLDINATTGAKRQAEGMAYFFPKGSTALDVAMIAEHECKDAEQLRACKDMVAAVRQRGGISRTYEEYVKGFKAVKGGGAPAGSKTGIKR